jgi:hypothetical protein
MRSSPTQDANKRRTSSGGEKKTFGNFKGKKKNKLLSLATWPIQLEVLREPSKVKFKSGQLRTPSGRKCFDDHYLQTLPAHLPAQQTLDAGLMHAEPLGMQVLVVVIRVVVVVGALVVVVVGALVVVVATVVVVAGPAENVPERSYWPRLA